MRRCGKGGGSSGFRTWHQWDLEDLLAAYLAADWDQKLVEALLASAQKEAPAQTGELGAPPADSLGSW